MLDLGDPVIACLLHWVNRAGGMHTPTWDEWHRDTTAALACYRTQLEEAKRKQAAALEYVHRAQFELIDHDLAAIAVLLNRLEKLLG